MPHTFVAGEVLTGVTMELLPKGRLGSATATTNQTGITTVVDLTSLTTTWTAISAHYYLIIGQILAQSTIATDVLNLTITDGSGTQVAQGLQIAGAVSTNISVVAHALLTGVAGSVTYKLRGARIGTGTMQASASSTAPMLIVVFDLGA